jgi:hypothetical protein
MSDVMSRDDKGRHYGMQNDRKNKGKKCELVSLQYPPRRLLSLGEVFFIISF